MAPADRTPLRIWVYLGIFLLFEGAFLTGLWIALWTAGAVLYRLMG